MRPSLLRLVKSPLIWTGAIAVLLVETVVVLATYRVERSRLHAAERDVTTPYPAGSMPSQRFSPFMVPGLQNPHIRSASNTKLGDGDVVIGIVVNGKPRAYSQKALSYPPWHVVNDVIDGVPASVTYCDQTDCTRVYTGAGQSSRPLDIAVAGLYGRELIVKVERTLYFQGTGNPFNGSVNTASLPYATLPWERSTWKEWRLRHPETEVFDGH